MKIILKLLKNIYKNALKSIAFYPILISACFFFFAIFCLSIENWDVVISIKEEVPFLFIQDYETARLILSTFIGGIISLTVFSFSMVMVVLGQASSNFSPRLLPGLVSNKKNQMILGVYIGTLLYCIIILISLGAYGVDSNSLGLSTMFSAIFGVVCIVLFVYFIHHISKAIQIHNIIDRIFKRSETILQLEHAEFEGNKTGLKYINVEGSSEIKSERSGYFRGFDIDLMEESIKKQNNQITIVPYVNQHIWEGMTILKLKNPTSDEELENLMLCIHISSNRHAGNNAIGGLIELMEIAVKAMSPGINDPGTAIDAINKLGILLAKLMQLPPHTSELIASGHCTLLQNNIPAKELMRILIQPIRLYSKHDNAVVLELIGALKFAKNGTGVSSENSGAIVSELKALKMDVKKSIENRLDRKRLLSLLDEELA